MIESHEIDNELVRSDNVKCITLADAVRLTDRRRWTVHGDQSHAHPSSAHGATPQPRLAQATASAETGPASLCRAVGWRHGAADRRSCRSRVDPAVRDRARGRGAGRLRQVGTRSTRRARTRRGPSGRHTAAEQPGGRDRGLSGLSVRARGARLPAAASRPDRRGGRPVGRIGPTRRRVEGQRASSALGDRAVSAVSAGRVPSIEWRYST